MILLLISQQLAFTNRFAVAATLVTRDPVAALPVTTCMTGTDGFAAAATLVTRDSVTAVTVATGRISTATVTMSMQMACTCCSNG